MDIYFGNISESNIKERELMFIYDFINVNEQGHLSFGGCDTVELAEQYGTPLYVFDEQVIRNACRSFKTSIEKYYNGNGMVLYASKAFSCKEMYRIVKQEGCGVDVVSGGELYTALSVGFPAENIVFHGNNKTHDELAMAVENNVGRVIVDNITELHELNKQAKKQDKIVKIMLRIKPGIDAHTHDFIRTGQIDSKFGFALETGEALEAAKLAYTYDNVELVGVHCHIGSQIFGTDPFEAAAEVMFDFIGKIKEATGKTVTELNLGGGFGIKYTDDDSPINYDEYMGEISKILHKKAEEMNFAMPRIYIEPGRAIVGPAGLTLYKVGAVKTIPNIRTYVSIDGGMGDNPRYALYQSSYDIHIANKADQPRDFKATIAGKCCESGDLIQEHTFIQAPEVGDIAAVLCTGAYNYSMASNYNRIPRPAAIMVKDGQSRVIIKRESYEDIVRNDI